MSEPKTFTIDEIQEQTGFDKRTIAYYVQQGLLPKVGRRGPKTRYPQLFMDRLQFVNMIRKKQDMGEIGSLTLAEIGDILNRVSAKTIANVVAGEEPLKVVDDNGGLQPLVSKAAVHDPPPPPVESGVGSSALAAEAAEISEGLMETAATENPTGKNSTRPVRLGLLDANNPASRSSSGEVESVGDISSANAGRQDFAGGDSFVRPARRYEDEIKKKEAGQADAENSANDSTDDDETEAAPPSIEIERLGWFLARLQRAMTGDRRRRTGTTESWQRALITPELTISARNLKDDDAYMLDAVARILKKLLWEAWED